MITQTERIKRYIEENGSITSLEAMEQLGVMRLASRISDMRKAGMQIEARTVKGRNRYGQPICYTRYSIPESEGVQ